MRGGLCPSPCGWVPALLLVTLMGAAAQVRAVGLDGPASALVRRSVAIGAGADRVSGYGHDTYPFVELSGSIEAVVWRRLVVGAMFSGRRDINDHDDALGRWTGEQTGGLAGQLIVGYDGPSFHVSLGPWLYGTARARPAFRAAVLPYGVLRLRFGHQDSWHFNVRLADGAPFTAEGGAMGLRLMLAAPPRGRHRAAGGLYTSIGEKTLGLAFADEVSGAGPGGRTLRLGALLGTDLERATTRPELTGFVGLLW